MNVWLMFAANVDKKDIVITGVSKENRPEAIKEAKKRAGPDYEYTVIDFSKDFDSVLLNLRVFLTDCGFPKEHISEIIQSIGEKLLKAFPNK